jgi:hypothetical protein
VDGLADDESLEVRNAGYRRAIEIVKSNAPEGDAASESPN